MQTTHALVDIFATIGRLYQENLLLQRQVEELRAALAEARDKPKKEADAK